MGSATVYISIEVQTCGDYNATARTNLCSQVSTTAAHFHAYRSSSRTAESISHALLLLHIPRIQTRSRTRQQRLFENRARFQNVTLCFLVVLSRDPTSYGNSGFALCGFAHRLHVLLDLRLIPRSGSGHLVEFEHNPNCVHAQLCNLIYLEPILVRTISSEFRSARDNIRSTLLL